MERNKIIASVFFQYEKRTLLILSIVFLFNLIFNLLAFLFVDSLSLPFFIGQAVGNLFFLCLYVYNAHGFNPGYYHNTISGQLKCSQGYTSQVCNL